MPKLHELLAVQGQLKGQARQTVSELAATFKSKRHLFEEKIVTFVPAEEGAEAVTETQSSLQTTVPKELAWIADLWTKALDTNLAVADANTTALADVVLDDGTVLMARVPATALLELEKSATEIQELVAAVPTLDPTKAFQPDRQRGDDVYVARDHVTSRTKKLQKPIVLYPATPEHPAQTQLITEDTPVGKVTAREWSGLITPAEKADIFGRVEALRRAIKQARARANDTTIATPREIGRTIFRYVFGR